jgi:hypothetical protein
MGGRSTATRAVQTKIGYSPRQVYSTVGQGVPGCFPSTTEYVKFRLVGAIPDVVSKTRAHFLWRVHKINGIPLPEPSPLNRSGIRTPQLLNDPGHNFYHVLNTPSRPWYVNLKTLPWKIALDEMVLPNAARGTSQIPEANSRMTQYVFSQKGWIYDTMRGAPGFVVNRRGPVPRINLTNFIVGLGTNAGGPKVVDCYDLAGGLECYINLIGADSNYHFLVPFGYLALKDLIGIGVCNNPFFNSPFLPGPQIVADTDNRGTRIFANHAYVIDGGKVFDANVGPALGLEDETNYRLSSMALDTPLQRAAANLGGASLMLRVRIAQVIPTDKE